MKAIETVIVDDEPAARKGLLHLLSEDPEISITAECHHGREAVEAIQNRRPELVFLDVEMPGLDGFGVLRETQGQDFPVVVFVTASDKHALHAFEVHAVDYLLKPFTDARFLKALVVAKNHVRQRRLGDLSQQVATVLSSSPAPTPTVDGVTSEAPGSSNHPLGRLLLRVDGGVTAVRVGDIDWIDAEGDLVRVRAGKISYAVRTTMEKLEDELDPTRFVRIHRSTIVNLERITELRPSYPGEYVAVLQDGTTLKISRHRRKLIKSRLGRRI
jgi:two-component system, LytTR family, response regulator